MAIDFNVVGGSNTPGKANVDTNYNLNITLPAVAAQSGFAQVTAAPPGSTDYHNQQITDEGSSYVATQYPLWDVEWNSVATAWATKIGTNATTMTKAPTSGFMRLNASSITTTTTGIAIYSTRVFNVEEAAELRVRMYVKTVNATATNKQAEIGLGYYNFAAGQANQMNEFIGFRWTTVGGLQAILSTSFGGVPTEQTLNINSNIPYSDNVTREYEILITESKVLFWVSGVYAGMLTRDPLSWCVLKSAGLPFIARVFNSGAASAAMNLDVGMINIRRASSAESMALSAIKAGMGSSSYYFQPDLGASAQTHVVPASGTAPTAAVGSNTASAFNAVTAMGGFYRNTLTGVTVTAHTNILVAAYQNPVIPPAQGAANNARNFVVTGLTISPMVVTTALTGGGFVGIWFAAIGTTATSLATTDADGTTAVAQKAPRFIPLSLTSTLAATAAVGVVSTDVGDHQFTFPTPLMVGPGEFLQIGFRTIQVTAAISAGAADGAIGVNGYWE